MKRLRIILFRIIFSLAVFFCFGLSSNSIYNFQPYSIALSADANSAMNSLIFDVDSFDDDQINGTNEYSSFKVLKPQTLIQQNCSLILNSFFSVWLPPKIC